MATKRKLIQGVQIGGAGMDLAALRALAKGAPAEFVARTQKLIDSGEISFATARKLDLLYAALRDVEVKVTMPDELGIQRAITTSAFPILLGGMVVKAVNDGYEQYPTIGDQLVEDLEDSAAVTVIAALRGMDKKADEVKEGDDFPEISASDEKFEIGEKRNGRTLRITAETIERNQIGDIVRRVNALSRIANVSVEKQTLLRVCDVYGSGTSAAAPYVYRPNGSGASLFSASANTPGTRAPSGTRIQNNALADETDLTAMRTRILTLRDEFGEPLPLNWNEAILLHPETLGEIVNKIKSSELIPGTTSSNAVNPFGPRGRYAGWTPLGSGMLDAHMDTTSWYFGWPKRQFVRKWALRYELVTLGMDTQAYLNSRIAFQARIAWNCEVGATDYVYWIQSLSGTTAPSAPAI